MRRVVVAALLASAACARPLELPAAPDAAAAPVVLEVAPDVAVGALGSPVLVRGHHLLDASTIEVGPIRFEKARGEFTARKGKNTDELLVHVTKAKLFAAKILDADGERYPVRVTVGDEVADSLDTIRVYAKRPKLNGISPRDLAPETLFAINGRGFDGEELAMNDVAFPPAPGTECWKGSDRTGKCLHAEMFWAARGLLMAVAPKTLPAGAVRVVYRNQQFEKLALTADAWTKEGRSLSDFFTEIDAETGISEAEAANPSVENVCAWATTAEVDAKIGELAFVWDDPGTLTVDPRVLNSVTVRGDGRLCYPLLSATQRVKLLIDGVAVPRTALTCAGEIALKVELPAAVLARPTMPHAIQVQNPRFTSPVAFFIPN